MSTKTAPYVLHDQEVKEPDPQILSLNSELIVYDETAARFLRDREVTFIRTGLGRLVNSYLVSNALATQPMDRRGCERMLLNILVLQQNLKNVEEGVDLARAANYYALFQDGPDKIVEKAKADSVASNSDGDGDGDAQITSEFQRFSYEEIKHFSSCAIASSWPIQREALPLPQRGRWVRRYWRLASTCGRVKRRGLYYKFSGLG